MRLHHLGIAVPSIEAGAQAYRLLGYHDAPGFPLLTDDLVQQARIAFLESDTGPLVELIAPLDATSHVHRILARDLGFYHCAYEVDDLDGAIADLMAAAWSLKHFPVPAVAFQGRRIAWLFSPLGHLVELVEAGG